MASPTKDQVAVQLGAILGKSFSDYNAFFNSELQLGRFLGQLINKIHPDLQAKLTAAESALNAQGYSPPQGSIYKVGGGDPLSGGHRWGLAVDINYDGNPYIMHESGEETLDQELFGIYERIVYLILFKEHSVINYNITKGVPGGFQSVTDAYTRLKEESDAMKKYFAFLGSDDQLAACADQWNAATPARPRMNLENWKATIKSDYLKLGGISDGNQLPPLPDKMDRPFVLKGGASASKRDPKLGFLDIPQTIVEALTGQGLIWGAIGFGPESGDVMHFDLRSGTFYSQVRQAFKNAGG